MSWVTFIVVLISCLFGADSVPEHSNLRIIGGHDVNITDVPFMARYCLHEYCCGAAILNNKYLISSAKCYYEFSSIGWRRMVIVGTDKQSTDGLKYVVEEEFPHPKFMPPYPPGPIPYFQYTGRNEEYNVVLLKLTKELKFSEKVRPIELADKSYTISEGAKLDALGFGIISDITLSLPKQLQEVSLPYISTEKCRMIYPFITDTMICVGAAYKSPSILDNGGPLVDSGRLVGILSTYAFRIPDHPSIYTYIPAVRDFLDTYLGQDQEEEPDWY